MSTSFDCPTCGRLTPHNRLYEKSQCTIFRCSQCGIGRTVAPEFDPSSYYTEDYFSGGHDDGYADYVGSEPVLRAEFAKIVSLLGQYCPRGGRVLEIGSAYGFFLLEAKKHFQAEGFEISTEAAEYARSRGLSVRDGIVDEKNLSEIGDIDAIVLLDVIEHLPDPYETLAMCWRYLKPGGVVLFTTGDFGSAPAKILGRKWRLMTPPQHLFFFTRKSVDALATRLGGTVKRFDHPGKVVPLNLILYQLPRILGLRPPKQAPKFGGSLGLPVNLFDAMRVVLHKPT